MSKQGKAAFISSGGDELEKLQSDCVFCGASGARQKCANCLIVYYCSRECQVAHWKVHKVICKEMCKEFAGKGADIAEDRRTIKAMLRAGQCTLEVRLFNASMEGFLPVVRQLIDEGANVNFVRSTLERDVTPLLVACERGHLSCVRALLEAGADVNWADRNGYYTLLAASERGHNEIVKLLLLQTGINVNMAFSKKSLRGETSLMRAMTYNYIEIVRSLLTHPGINVNAKRKSDDSALSLACSNDEVEIALMLLAHPDIDVNLSIIAGGKVCSSLTFASGQGHTKIVSALLAHPNIDMTSPGANAECLIEASARGNHEVAQLLLSHPDVDVNLSDLEIGRTALFMACLGGHVEVVRVLLSAPGIDVNKSVMGMSPLHAAKRCRHTEITILLSQAGAR